MAFIFVPNDDGGFTEGDKQTNPDTGVEYIYLDGAWRALGPKIENEFDTLDDRYINSEVNDAMNGRLTFNNEVRFGPNDTGISRIRLMQTEIDGGNKFQLTSHPRPEGALSSSRVHIEIKRETEGTPETILRFLPEPENDDWAVPRNYLDNYLPLSGGTLTGTLTSNATVNKRIEFLTNDSSDHCDISKDGNTIISFQSGLTKINTPLDLGSNKIAGVNTPTNPKDAANKEYVDSVTLTGDYLPLSGGTLTGTLTGQLIKSIRSSNGYAIEVKPGDTSTKAFIRTDGTSRLATLTVESPLASSTERPFEIKGRLSDGSTVSKDFFYVYANSTGTASAVNYDGKISAAKNIVNKGYVDNKISGGRLYVSSGNLYWEMS